MSKIYHHEIFGSRESKYDWLNKHSIKNVKWKKVTPYPPFYLFIPTDNKLANHYYSFDSIIEIFPVNSVGIVTARDSLTIGWSEDEIWKRIQNFARLDEELARQTYRLGKDARDWKVELAQKDLKDSGLTKNHIVEILYRPFDVRFTYYTGKSRGFHCMPRDEVMRNMLSTNLALITIRRSRSQDVWKYAFVSETISSGATSITALDINYVFPLYIFSEPEEKKKRVSIQMAMFEPETKYQAKKPNIKPGLFEELKKNFEKEITPEQIFYYIYAVLYCNIYRKKYEAFLKIDFPRIPFTKNYKLFIQLGKLGKKLSDLHLLSSKDLDKAVSKFPVEGSNKVEKLKYENEKVWINKNQYFDGIKEEVWQYQIGGYQVCGKWLKDKDRKGRTLSLDEVTTYSKIVISLSKTIELQKKIDSLYEKLELTIAH